MSSAVNIMIGPAPTFRLLGLPERFIENTADSLQLPPCPVCGQTIEIDTIEITAFGGPRTFIPGPWECPSGCDPRFRRFVLAADRRDFDHFCREHRWNPRRIIFVPTDRFGRGDQEIMGRTIHPGMIHETGRARPDDRLRDMIMARIDRDVRWNSTMVNAFNINLIAIHHPPWVSRSIRLEGHRLPWSGTMVEADCSRVVPQDDESSRWPDAYRWIPS